MKKTVAAVAMGAFLLAGVAQAQVVSSPAYPSYAVYPGQSYCPTLSYNLYRGLFDRSTAGQVSALQYYLGQYFAYEPVPVTGYFGPITAGFVARFQREQGVYPVTGGVGPLTRAAIQRVCGGSNPYPSSIQVTSPSTGTIYTRGSQVAITWSGSASSQAATVVDLYSVSMGKIGTVAIQNGAAGSYSWTVPPFPNTMLCTLQYPNGLCGASIPEGQYFIKATLVAGNGFNNGAQLASANSGTFTIGGTNQGLGAYPQAGPSPLTVTFSVPSPSPGSYWAISFGDGQSANTLQGSVTHTYAARGTYYAQATSDLPCLHTAPQCYTFAAQQLLGSAAVTVY